MSLIKIQKNHERFWGFYSCTVWTLTYLPSIEGIGCVHCLSGQAFNALAGFHTILSWTVLSLSSLLSAAVGRCTMVHCPSGKWSWTLPCSETLHISNRTSHWPRRHLRSFTESGTLQPRVSFSFHPLYISLHITLSTGQGEKGSDIWTLCSSFV